MRELSRPFFLRGKPGCLLALLAGFSCTTTSGDCQTLPRELDTRPVIGHYSPSQGRGTALDSTGWRFASMPRPEAVDEHSGEIRFRIMVDKTGHIESITPVFSSVSAAQEQLCRAALLTTYFEYTGPHPRRASGFYTFRFTIR